MPTLQTAYKGCREMLRQQMTCVVYFGPILRGLALQGMEGMNCMGVAETSENGQGTEPEKSWQQLGPKFGGQISPLENPSVGVIATDASAAIRKAQAAFAGAGEELGITSVDDIQALVEEIRYGRE